VLAGHSVDTPVPEFKDHKLVLTAECNSLPNKGFISAVVVEQEPWVETILREHGIKANDQYYHLSHSKRLAIFIYLDANDVKAQTRDDQLIAGRCNAYIVSVEWLEKLSQIVAIGEQELKTACPQDTLGGRVGHTISNALRTVGNKIWSTRYSNLSIDLEQAIKAGAAAKVKVHPNRIAQVSGLDKVQLVLETRGRVVTTAPSGHHHKSNLHDEWVVAEQNLEPAFLAAVQQSIRRAMKTGNVENVHIAGSTVLENPGTVTLDTIDWKQFEGNRLELEGGLTEMNPGTSYEPVFDSDVARERFLNMKIQDTLLVKAPIDVKKNGQVLALPTHNVLSVTTANWVDVEPRQLSSHTSREGREMSVARLVPMNKTAYPQEGEKKRKQLDHIMAAAEFTDVLVAFKSSYFDFVMFSGLEVFFSILVNVIFGIIG